MLTVTNELPEKYTPRVKIQQEKTNLRPSQEPMSIVHHEKKIIAERFNNEKEVESIPYEPTEK